MAQPPRVGVLGHSMERPSVGQDGLGCVKTCDRVHERKRFGAAGVAVRVRDAPYLKRFPDHFYFLRRLGWPNGVVVRCVCCAGRSDAVDVFVWWHDLVERLFVVYGAADYRKDDLALVWWDFCGVDNVYAVFSRRVVARVSVCGLGGA